ncbi:hypothetical protein [Allosphingosinicella indica]|uniref:Predicted 5' DNA nuclease, flap endonuclease-1-like, helix-3-turn-helix (H3TH) domain n=1 Tax=Allosphingosinicella indica TaxID=941907 RepID=A0A1X7GC40_9SPHN|nr:hypothetical protein [Allosphingosinicella indica]SMF66781.1 Predicted 5' DNA nuclease, flap endonuclease-1-like, helix-3-turn-helix (H3TH) domain [Allosphingosinicella indica]
MNELFNTYLIPIIVALTIGVIVGVWLFRSRRSGPVVRDTPLERVGQAEDPRPGPGRTHPLGDPLEARPSPLTETPPPPAPVQRQTSSRDGTEGNGLIDQGAAATADVAGSVLGVKAHQELPGADGPPDNLQTLKGVGPKMAAKLNEHGITRFSHIARLSDSELARLDEDMGAFRGRLTRDRVREQADYLARDDRDAFEAKFGKLGGA